MAKKKGKKKAAAKPVSAPQPKDFLDMAAPTAVKFNTDHAIVGGVYRTFMALRGTPPPLSRWPCCGAWAKKAA